VPPAQRALLRVDTDPEALLDRLAARAAPEAGVAYDQI
jgi:hypothetical protein